MSATDEIEAYQPTPLQKIESDREDLEFIEDAYLRKKGWRHSSSYPGAFWLWEVRHEEDHYNGVSKNIAVAMQSHWDDLEAYEAACRDAGGELNEC